MPLPIRSSARVLATNVQTPPAARRASLLKAENAYPTVATSFWRRQRSAQIPATRLSSATAAPDRCRPEFRFRRAEPQIGHQVERQDAADHLCENVSEEPGESQPPDVRTNRKLPWLSEARSPAGSKFSGPIELVHGWRSTELQGKCNHPHGLILTSPAWSTHPCPIHSHRRSSWPFCRVAKRLVSQFVSSRRG